MGWLRKRFGEGSTHAGIGMAALLVSQAFPQYAALAQVLAATMCGTAIALPDAGNK